MFITGSSTGLGRATAKLFAAKGWNVFASMRNPARESELSGISGVVLLELDVTNPQQIETAVERALAEGHIDVVFNNAGYGLGGPLEGISDLQIVRMIETNLPARGRSCDLEQFALVKRVMNIITDPKQMEEFSTPEQVAYVVYEAATDEKKQLRYLVGADAKAI